MSPNTVELIGYYGSDETHALSAWTSTSRELTPERKARIPAFLTQLASAGHHSVFEKSALHFLCTTDIATHIQLLKHRIGVSINAESARYKELKSDRYYTPPDWPQRDGTLQTAYENHMKESFALYHWTIARLEAQGVSRQRAKESARFVLPYANQIACDVQLNWRSFHHFLSLRTPGWAQAEIATLGRQMLALVSALPGNPFQHTIRAFGWDLEIEEREQADGL